VIVELPLTSSSPSGTLWSLFILVVLFYVVVSGIRSLTSSWSERMRPSMLPFLVIVLLVTWTQFRGDGVESVRLEVTTERAAVTGQPAAPSTGQTGDGDSFGQPGDQTN
jgi:hypothetical protein